MCNDEWRRPLKCHGILRQASKREIFLSAHFVGADEHSHEGHEECKCTKMCFRVRLSFDLRCDVLGTRWTFYPDRIWTNFGRVSSDESSLSWRWWEINKRQINIFMTSLVTFNFRRCFLSQKRRFTYFSFFLLCTSPHIQRNSNLALLDWHFDHDFSVDSWNRSWFKYLCVFFIFQ